MIISNAKDGNLTFSQVRVEDAGKYRCEAGNGIGDYLQKAITFIVHGKVKHKTRLFIILSC